MMVISTIAGAVIGLTALAAGYFILKLPLLVLALIYPIAGGLSCHVLQIYLDYLDKRAAMLGPHA